MEEKKARQTYGLDQQDKLRQVFDKAANESPKNRHAMSMRNLIGTLSADIRALRARGYTIAEICDLISGTEDFKAIAPSTLHRYVSAATGKRRRPRRKTITGHAKAQPATTAATDDAASPYADAAARQRRRREDIGRFGHTQNWAVSMVNEMAKLRGEHGTVWGEEALQTDGWTLLDGQWAPPQSPGKAHSQPHYTERAQGMAWLLEQSMSSLARSAIAICPGNDSHLWQPESMAEDGWKTLPGSKLSYRPDGDE